MIAIWVKVRVKPEGLERFLAGIETDALGSERDEPGCMRFNVLQDAEDELTYYFYEVYEDEAALAAHREAPHYAAWAAVSDTLEGPIEITRAAAVFPSAKGYWWKTNAGYDDLMVTTAHPAAERPQRLKDACRKYHVTSLELVGRPETVDFESRRDRPEFIVSYEDGFSLPWAGHFTQLGDALEEVYGRPIGLIMEGSERGIKLREGDCTTTTIYAA